MTIDKFIRYVYDLARKDGKGNVVSPAAIVNWLNYVMLDDFNELLTQALTLSRQRNVPLANVIFDMKDLRRFVTPFEVALTGTQVGGVQRTVCDLPEDFKYELGCTAQMVNVELLSSTMLPKYRGSVLNGMPAESPKGFIGGGKIEFIPNDLEGPVVLDYLRTPAYPYYDFCLSATDDELFMPEGSRILLNDANVPCLYDGDGNLLATAVVKDGISYPYTSLTVELDWDETNHVRFANNVAHKLGINLGKQLLAQTQ